MPEDSMTSAEDDLPQAMIVPVPEEGEEERIRRILERGLKIRDGSGALFKMHSSFPLPGTTFPPNRFVNVDLVRAKFRSESDLIPALDNKARESEAVENDSENASDMSANDVGDSDLFFDFDIGSPEPAEADETDRVINQNDDVMIIGLGPVMLHIHIQKHFEYLVRHINKNLLNVEYWATRRKIYYLNAVPHIL